MNRPDAKPSSVSWLSLLYDLILVAVIGRATSVYIADPTWETLAFVFLALLATFILWALTTLELLLTERETWPVRGLVFAQVIALLIAALAMTRGGGLNDQFGFGSLAVGFLTVAGLEFARIRRNAESLRQGQWLLMTSLVSAALFAYGAFYPMGFRLADGVLIAWINYPIAVLFAATATILVAAPRLASARQLSAHALNERFGVLLLIVLGETFLSLLHGLGTLREIPSLTEFVLSLVFVAAVWLLYFPTISEPELPRSAAMVRARVSTHFLLVTSTAFSLVPYVSLAAHQGGEGHEGARPEWTLLPVIGIVVAVAILTLLNDRRWSDSVSVHVASAIALCGVALASRAGLIDAVFALYVGVVVLLSEAIIVVLLRERKTRT